MSSRHDDARLVLLFSPLLGRLLLLPCFLYCALVGCDTLQHLKWLAGVLIYEMVVLLALELEWLVPSSAGGLHTTLCLYSRGALNAGYRLNSAHLILGVFQGLLQSTGWGLPVRLLGIGQSVLLAWPLVMCAVVGAYEWRTYGQTGRNLLGTMAAGGV